MIHLPRDQETVNRNQRDRIRNLERGRPANPRPTTEDMAVFSIVGDMTVSTSGVHRARRGGQVVAVNFDAAAAGTGDTVFDVWVNGAAVGSTVTVDDAATSDSFYIGNVRISAGDLIQIDLTTAGMHEGAVIQVVMKG